MKTLLQRGNGRAWSRPDIEALLIARSDQNAYVVFLVAVIILSTVINPSFYTCQGRVTLIAPLLWLHCSFMVCLFRLRACMLYQVKGYYLILSYIFFCAVYVALIFECFFLVCMIYHLSMLLKAPQAIIKLLKALRCLEMPSKTHWA